MRRTLTASCLAVVLSGCGGGGVSLTMRFAMWFRERRSFSMSG